MKYDLDDCLSERPPKRQLSGLRGVSGDREPVTQLMADKSAKRCRREARPSNVTEGRTKERTVGEIKKSVHEANNTYIAREWEHRESRESRYRNDNRNTRATATPTAAATAMTAYAQSANERAAKRSVAKKKPQASKTR